MGFFGLAQMAPFWFCMLTVDEKHQIIHYRHFIILATRDFVLGVHAWHSIEENNHMAGKMVEWLKDENNGGHK
jgi:hypothetical protein